MIIIIIKIMIVIEVIITTVTIIRYTNIEQIKIGRTYVSDLLN